MSLISLAANPHKFIKSKATVGVIQVCLTNDWEANYEKNKRYIQECADKGAHMVCLPENFAFIGNNFEEGTKFAESLYGPVMKKYCKLALKNRVWISYGGFQEKSFKQQGKRYSKFGNLLKDTHIIVNDEGVIVDAYRKIHLFDVELASKGGMNLYESKHILPGDTIYPPTPSPLGYLGLSICYDLRFPEVYRNLFMKGSQVLLVPSCFLNKTGGAHWETLLRARAIENQCYVIAAAQVGQHNEKRSSYGHSIVIDPWGDIVGQMSDKEGYFMADVDLDYVDSVRENMDCMSHMKRELFSRL